MEANSNNNRIDSLITSPLLDNGIPNEQSSDTFIRRSTFIPTPKDAGSLDENSLTAMGFDEGMVKKAKSIFTSEFYKYNGFYFNKL